MSAFSLLASWRTEISLRQKTTPRERAIRRADFYSSVDREAAIRAKVRKNRRELPILASILVSYSCLFLGPSADTESEAINEPNFLYYILHG